jgi:teichuronic acid biosynthesis glycosyltransferase TuaH
MTDRGTDTQLRLLFIMHVDWGWIKLRPHFIAEELAFDGFRVLVCYIPDPHRARMTANPSFLRRVPLPVSPRRNMRVIRAINRRLAGPVLSVIKAAWTPDAVLLTHPDVHDILPSTFAKLPIFYDCMDLAVGFARNDQHRDLLEAADRMLSARAKLVFVPSESLRLVIHRGGVPADRLVVVRNGHPATAPPARGGGMLLDKPTLDLGFVGTIAGWIDFDALLAALDHQPRLRVHLWGPTVVRIPAHDRLVWHGVVARDELDSAVAFVDGFVLPFHLSELITVVDPIKLYEYIAWGRPVISVYYAELDHFAPFVHFYRTTDELVSVLQRLSDGELSAPDPIRAQEFLRQSTWKVRAKIMGDAMRASIVADRASSGIE